MEWNKQIRIVFIGNGSPLVQLQKAIVFSRVNHLNIFMVGFNHFAKGKCELQSHILFFGGSTQTTRIMPAMTRIDHNGTDFVGFKAEWIYTHQQNHQPNQ